jgi:hypothetical protein
MEMKAYKTDISTEQHPPAGTQQHSPAGGLMSWTGKAISPLILDEESLHEIDPKDQALLSPR